MSTSSTVSFIKLAPVALRHSIGMLLQRPLKPEKIGKKKLAGILGWGERDLDGFQWQLVHQGTTSRWRLQLPAKGKTLFAKTSPPDFTTRFFGAMFQLGLNEMGFYRDIRPELTIQAPASFGLLGNRYRYLILIDDLAERATFSDIKSRCDFTQAKSVVDTLAQLHAGCWQSPKFDTQWQWVNRQQYKRNHAFLTMIRQQSSITAVKRYAELLPEGVSSLAKQINQNYDWLEQRWGEGERTLVHGDAHIGNMYFLPDGSTGLLDWQVLGYEHGMRDVTYFMINSLPTELRRSHQNDLINRYVDQLKIHGVELDRSLAFEQYTLHAPYVWISAAVTAASNTMQEKKIAAAGLIRASKAMVDLNIAQSLGH